MAKKQAIEWLLSAYSDLKNIQYILNDEFLTHVVAFHCQQAIEKSLKASLENSSKDVPKVHKLQNLIAKVDFNIDVNDEIIMILDELYIESRYPGDMGLLPNGKPRVGDAKEFYAFASPLFEEVCEIFGINKREVIDDKQ